LPVYGSPAIFRHRRAESDAAGVRRRPGDGKVRAMATVLGIGGVFVKSKDPEQLGAWYRDMLGFEIQAWGGAQLWSTPGKTYAVWSPFAADTKYFEPSTRELMINFRVDDLDGLVAELRRKGANVLDRREESEDGKFGYVVDPDGTLLELWQPSPRTDAD
jgi:catechol 2,3-dioxygenase-like lactoylglutathione lyase family enzyme